MKNSPYNLKKNYFTLACKIEKIEEAKQSQSGNYYVIIWLSQDKYYKEEKTTHNFKVALFNEAATDAVSTIEEDMWVRVTGSLKGTNKDADNGAVFNDISLSVQSIEPLSVKSGE